MKQLTPMKAIRLKCLDCCCEQKQEVRACPVLKCSLWKFRLGLHPFTDKNRANPFLEPSNFIGLEGKSAVETIKEVEKKH